MQSYAALVWLLAAAAAADRPEVQTCYGKMRGQYTTTRGGRTVAQFLGVRYAKPPLNHLKFLNAQEPDCWEGVRDATTECDFCLQQLTLTEATQLTISGSEDCLCMNIFTPNVTADIKMPVLVWIHGGAFLGLSPLKDFYGPEMMLDQDVVCVSFGYRIGVLGFMTTGDEVLPGNLCLKDQAAALRWVKTNIGQFGGDAESITLWGESTGAVSAHLHMLSPLTHKLFHRAIIHSSSALNTYVMAEHGVLRERSRYVAELIGCPATPSRDFLACLQETPSATIVNTTHKFVVWDIDPAVIWSPVVEPASTPGAFLTENPWHSTSTKPLLAGYNYAEGGLKLLSVTAGNVTEKFRRWNKEFEKLTPIILFYNTTAPDKTNVTKKVRAFYLGKHIKVVSPNMTVQLNKMFGDFWYVNGVLDGVDRHKGPKYLYHYNYNTSYSVCSKMYDNDLYVGACHLDELMSFFNMNMSALSFYDPDHQDYKTSVQLVQMWTNFAKHSVPTGGDVAWDPVTTDALEYLEISNTGMAMKDHPIPDRRSFWKTLTLRRPDNHSHMHVFD